MVSRFSFLRDIPRWTRLGLSVALAATLLAGCSGRQILVRGLADELATQGRAAEEDLELARDASAFYLKLSESLLREDPGHVALAEAVAGGFTQYAYAFVGFDADRLETTDARGAQAMRERAAKLYRRGQRHALAALEIHAPGLLQSLAHGDAENARRLQPAHLGLAYWAAAAWGGAISLSKDDPEAVADLPLAIRLAQMAWAVDPDYGDGALASLLGSFEGSRPGGSRTQALAYFDRAIALAAGRSSGAYVAKAEGYALPNGDRRLFEELLGQAQAIQDATGSPLALQNEVMRRRARWLQSRAEDLF